MAAGGYGFVRQELPADKGSRPEQVKAQKWNVWNKEPEPEEPVAEQQSGEDIFIPVGRLRGALNKDKVKVAILSLGRQGQGPEGEVVEVLERNSRPYTGILRIAGKKAWVITENRFMPYDIEVVNTEDIKREYNGLKVAVLITGFPKGSLTPLGKFLEVLGKAGENDTEMCSILVEYGLPNKFPDYVEAAAAKIPCRITAADLKGRKDFRDTCTFTIDPADAKDFDDACSLKKLDNGNWEVGVHIADVSYYVKPGSVLDKEAYERATSVYLVDRTIPMLPEKLSNNLCSLRPGEDKLTFSAVFELDEKGKLINEWFGRTIINSDFRFAYEEAQQIIDNKGVTKGYTPVLVAGAEGINTKKTKTKGKKGEVITNDVTGLTTAKPSKEIAEAVLQLHKLASVLRKKRFAEGSVQFERPEMKVLTDEKGKPIDVIEKVTKEANWLIEEFMLLANKEVATFVAKKVRRQSPTFVYRIHDQPNMEKVVELKTFIKHFGYQLGASDTPLQLAKALNKLTEQLRGKPECDTIELLALRCMARAQYTTDNIGHYGLGFRYYTHFTSPIRRYPDTMVHRLLSRYLEQGKSADKQQYEEYCKHSSEREQLATEAERASIKYKMTEFMQDKIGQEFDGVISGLTERAIYVSVEPTKIEGVISLRDIKDDYFKFDEQTYTVVAQASGQKYTIGDKVRVKVMATSLEQKIIEMAFVKQEDAVAEEAVKRPRNRKSSKNRKK